MIAIPIIKLYSILKIMIGKPKRHKSNRESNQIEQFDRSKKLNRFVYRIRLGCKIMNLSLTFNRLVKEWFSIRFLGLLLIPMLSQLTDAKQSSDSICKKSNIGSYIIASQGSKKNIPISQI